MGRIHCQIIFSLILSLALLASPAALAQVATYQYVDPPETVGDQEGDLYMPTGHGRFPLVVLVHSGGFVSGDKTDGASVGWATFLENHGYASFSIDYTLADEDLRPPAYHYAQNDVQCAVMYARWAATTSLDADWARVDPDRVYILGMSAGGNLAGWVGALPDLVDQARYCVAEPMAYRAEAVDGTVIVSGMVDFVAKADAGAGFNLDENEIEFLGSETCESPDAYGICSVSGCNLGQPDRGGVCTRQTPVTYIDGDEEPFLIIHGDADEVIPLAVPESLATALIAAGVSHELHLCPGMAHAGRPDEDCFGTLVGELVVGWLDWLGAVGGR